MKKLKPYCFNCDEPAAASIDKLDCEVVGSGDVHNVGYQLQDVRVWAREKAKIISQNHHCEDCSDILKLKKELLELSGEK
jgi:hypothetical protein